MSNPWAKGSYHAVISRRTPGFGFPIYRTAIVTVGSKRVHLDGYWWTVVNRL